MAMTWVQLPEMEEIQGGTTVLDLWANNSSKRTGGHANVPWVSWFLCTRGLERDWSWPTGWDGWLCHSRGWRAAWNEPARKFAQFPFESPLKENSWETGTPGRREREHLPRLLLVREFARSISARLFGLFSKERFAREMSAVTRVMIILQVKTIT